MTNRFTGQGDGNRWLYNLCLSFWILIGLAWVANLIANFQELYKNIGKAAGVEDDEKEQGVANDYTIDREEGSKHALNNGKDPQQSCESTQVRSACFAARKRIDFMSITHLTPLVPYHLILS